MKVSSENIFSLGHRPSGRPSVPHLKALKPSGIGNYSPSARPLPAAAQLNAHGFRLTPSTNITDDPAADLKGAGGQIIFHSRAANLNIITADQNSCFRLDFLFFD